MRTRRLVLIAVLASVPLVAACGTGPTSPDSGNTTCSMATSTAACTTDTSRKKEQSPWN